MLRRRSRLLLTIFISLCYAWALNANTGRYRCMWRDDPATTMVVGWDQASGYDPVLFYDVIDFGAQVAAYRNKQQPDRIIVSKGMNNHFVRLAGLQPNTIYYFVIQDSEGVSRRFSFKTAPNTPTETTSLVGTGSESGHYAWQVTANLMSFVPNHNIGFVVAHADAGWLLSPDFSPNQNAYEIRHQWKINK